METIENYPLIITKYSHLFHWEIKVDLSQRSKKIQTQKIAVIILKFEHCGFTSEQCIQQMQNGKL